MEPTVAIVHNTIIIDGVEHAPGTKLFGDKAEEALANQIWARSVTRAPAGMHEIPDDVAAPVAPSTPSAPPPPPAASAPSGTSATITDTTKAP